MDNHNHLAQPFGECNPFDDAPRPLRGSPLPVQQNAPNYHHHSMPAHRHNVPNNHHNAMPQQQQPPFQPFKQAVPPKMFYLPDPSKPAGPGNMPMSLFRQPPQLKPGLHYELTIVRDEGTPWSDLIPKDGDGDEDGMKWAWTRDKFNGITNIGTPIASSDKVKIARPVPVRDGRRKERAVAPSPKPMSKSTQIERTPIRKEVQRAQSQRTSKTVVSKRLLEELERVCDKDQLKLKDLIVRRVPRSEAQTLDACEVEDAVESDQEYVGVIQLRDEGMVDVPGQNPGLGLDMDLGQGLIQASSQSQEQSYRPVGAQVLAQQEFNAAQEVSNLSLPAKPHPVQQEFQVDYATTTITSTDGTVSPRGRSLATPFPLFEYDFSNELLPEDEVLLDDLFPQDEMHIPMPMPMPMPMLTSAPGYASDSTSDEEPNFLDLLAARDLEDELREAKKAEAQEAVEMTNMGEMGFDEDIELDGEEIAREWRRLSKNFQ